MPTSADLGSSVIASFVLSADGITGQSTERIEGNQHAQEQQRRRGRLRLHHLGRNADCSHQQRHPDTNFQASSDLATIFKNKIQPTDKTMAAFALLTQPTAIQQCTFDLLGVPLRLV
jgi:hypothetical protein